MTTRIELSLTFDGPFNVGAGALGGSLADKSLTRDARGLPMVPASAFKGRLRHEIERLVPTLRPHAPPPCASPLPETMCQGDQEPCPVCRLFGSPWYIGKLTFTDFTLTEPAFLTTEEAPPGDLRYGVGLSRQRRVAEDKLLYTTEVFLPGTPITLSGTLSGDLDEQELALVRAGLDSLFTIGGGKTKGLGWFDLTINVHEEPEPASAPHVLEKRQESWLEVIVKLDSSMLLGTEANEAYFKTTHTYIPGAVLRGSLARQMLSACDHPPQGPHDDCDFGRLFGDGVVPVFEHLYPTTAGAREFSFPAPLTARSCKYHPGFVAARDKKEQGHGVGDVLIRQTVFEWLEKKGLLLPALYQPRCPECQEAVERFDDFVLMVRANRFDSIVIPARRISRTAINRQRAVAADGQLYTLEMIEPLDNQRRPITFRGRVRGSPTQLGLLAHWLPRLATVGRGQSTGLGQVNVEVKRPDEITNPLPSLGERLKEFNKAMREEWSFYQRVAGAGPLPEDVFLFSLDLLSPASLTWHGLPVTAPLPEMLGFEKGVRLQRAFADYHMRGGWHLGANLPRRTRLTVTMGSVFLYRSEGYSLPELEERLTSLETSGISNDRARGMGRVLVCSPFHYQPEVTL
jgi:CRISPR-associated Csx10 family RAMP protein